MPVMVYDKIDEVPQDLRAKATEVEGKFQVDAEGLLKKHGELLTEAKEAKRLREQLKAFEGIDPEETRKVLEDREKQLEEARRKSGNWEEQKAELQKNFTKEKEKLTQRHQTLEKALRKALIENAAVLALTTANAKVKAMLPHVVNSMEIFEQDGEFVAKVIEPRTGKPRIVDSSGTEMQLEQLIEEFKKDPEYQGNFLVDQHAGSGAHQSKTPSKTDAEFAKLPATERLKLARRQAAKA